MECGQYSDTWPDIHMKPEQSAQANLDLRGRVMMPIHWGAFDLSLHRWDDPPRRLCAAAERLGMQLALPRIGETFSLDDPPQTRWWETIPQ